MAAEARVRWGAGGLKEEEAETSSPRPSFTAGSRSRFHRQSILLSYHSPGVKSLARRIAAARNLAASARRHAGGAACGYERAALICLCAVRQSTQIRHKQAPQCLRSMPQTLPGTVSAAGRCELSRSGRWFEAATLAGKPASCDATSSFQLRIRPAKRGLPMQCTSVRLLTGTVRSCWTVPGLVLEAGTAGHGYPSTACHVVWLECAGLVPDGSPFSMIEILVSDGWRDSSRNKQVLVCGIAACVNMHCRNFIFQPCQCQPVEKVKNAVMLLSGHTGHLCTR